MNRMETLFKRVWSFLVDLIADQHTIGHMVPVFKETWGLVFTSFKTQISRDNFILFFSVRLTSVTSFSQELVYSKTVYVISFK